MVAHNTGLLLRRTGPDVGWWLAEVRALPVVSEADTRRWLAVNVRAGDPFTGKVRLPEAADVDANIAEILLRSYAANI